MKAKYFLAFLVLGYLPSISQDSSQQPQKVETKFFRPAITSVFAEPAIDRRREAELVIDAFSKMQPEKRFDDHRINLVKVPLSRPEPPKEPSPEEKLTNPGVNKAYQEALVKYQKDVAQSLLDAATVSSNQIIGKWWSRDKDGNMSDRLILQRGQFTANDAQVLSDRASEVSRIGNLGYQLLGRSYVLLYDVSDIKTQEEIYDEMDKSRRETAEASKGKIKYEPVKRDMEGYRVSLSAHLFKVIWNDSVQNRFFNDYYLDASEKSGRENKIRAFDNAKFGLQYVGGYSASSGGTQLKNPPANVKKRSMEELLVDRIDDAQESVIKAATKQVDDFKIKVTVFQDYPTMAKVGTKEGLYYDERFFVFEIQEDANKNQIKKRQGVVRVKQIADNDTIASGESPSSQFQQQGGKKIYSGMLMEMREDIGAGLMVGIGTGGNLAGGLNLSFDYRLTSILKDQKALRGVRLGIQASFSPGKYDLEISDVVGGDSFNDNVSGSGTLIGFTLGKEMYFSKRGVVYLFPELGYAIGSLSVSKVDGEKVKDFFGFEKLTSLDFSADKGSIFANLGLGINLSPRVSLNFKFMLGPNFKSFTAKDQEDGDTKYTAYARPASTISNLDPSKASGLIFGLRFRF